LSKNNKCLKIVDSVFDLHLHQNPAYKHYMKSILYRCDMYKSPINQSNNFPICKHTCPLERRDKKWSANPVILVFLFTTLIILGYSKVQAQDLSNCKKTCKKTRIVKTGPIIGLRTLTLPDSLYVKVVEVVRNGASYKNGILLGDTITHFNGKAIQNMNYFIGEVAKLQPDDTVQLLVKRNGTVSEYRFPLGASSTKKVTEIVCCDEPESKPEPKTEPITAPIAKNEPKRKSKPEPEPIQAVGPDLETELEPEPISKNEPKRKAKRELEPIQDVGPDVEPETETEPTTKNEPKPKRKAKREAEPIQSIEPNKEPELEPEPIRKPEPKPDPIPTPKPQPKPVSEAQQLEELEQNNLTFILSPNPAKEYLLVKCYEEIKTEVTLDLQDPNGNVVLSEKVSKMKGNFEAKLNISKLPDGVYFVKIYVEQTKYIQRFVKGE
jgi:hypothetical protein